MRQGIIRWEVEARGAGVQIRIGILRSPSCDPQKSNDYPSPLHRSHTDDMSQSKCAVVWMDQGGAKTIVEAAGVRPRSSKLLNHVQPTIACGRKEGAAES